MLKWSFWRIAGCWGWTSFRVTISHFGGGALPEGFLLGSHSEDSRNNLLVVWQGRRREYLWNKLKTSSPGLINAYSPCEKVWLESHFSWEEKVSPKSENFLPVISTPTGWGMVNRAQGFKEIRLVAIQTNRMLTKEWGGMNRSYTRWETLVKVTALGPY